jgi:thiamine biosynthesis lipoprotein
MKRSQKIIGAFTACAAVLTLTSCSSEPVTKEFYAFDTYGSITLYDGKEKNVESLKDLLYDISDEIQAVYDTDANALDGDYLTECAEISREMSLDTGGMINITCGRLTELWGISTGEPKVPSQSEIDEAMSYMTDDFDSLSALPDGVRLDLGSSAKGYACDKANEYLESTSESCGIVSLGSSTLLYGEKPDGSTFKAAVKDPESPSDYLGVISTPAAFVSTSGGYERYFEEDGVKYEHILSMETGFPVETDLTSVTVIVPANYENGGIFSDMLATLIYAGGTAKLGEYLSSEEYYVIAADDAYNVYTSTESAYGVEFTLYEEDEYRIAELAK